MNAEELAVLVRQRIESRYRRILFVHEELERLNSLARLEPSAKPELLPQQKNQIRSYEDFVFSRINFSVYKKIATEEFTLLFDKGLADYDDAFFPRAFSLSRDEVRETIKKSYVKAGPFYLCKKSSPLLLSIMRTLHTSLDFAPLLASDEITDEDQIKSIAEVLDGLVIQHDDGMETKLFMPKTEEKSSGTQGQRILCGTFHPLGKACTITLL